MEEPMGFAKSMMMEWDERGYGPCDEHAVCPAHVHDWWLAARVREAADRNCTYCGSQGAAASLEAVLPYVMDAVRGFHGSALTHLDSEGQADAPDGEDVLYQISEGVDFDEDVAGDIAKALSHNDQRWISLSEHPAGWLGAGWERFCRWVTEESRFLLQPPDEAGLRFGEQPQTMLASIGELIFNEDLFSTLDEGSALFRARAFPASASLRHACHFSAPPDALAQPGRMNPRGIALFYGSLDPETAAIEVYTGDRRAAVAEFHTLQPLEVVDLTVLPALPSIYNAEEHGRWDSILFLRHFCDHIARPVDRDGAEELAYLPSQAVTEYLRLALPTLRGEPVNGLLFRSSRVRHDTPLLGAGERPSTGVNIVLFCGAHGALSDHQLPKRHGSLPAFREHEQWLRLKGDSAAIYDYGPPHVARSDELPL